ncbi:hypothetical protein Val02_56960 [Virgisporangium aliadipatigenens]|uniref:Uncharacterized protein n=1 Tax=Virgisporangium aliadipatigenens TaxID=741659 RepID=A0A8J3YRW0_9ACTN|nr:hypothetical protein [Virgisporangium aliadipatigenens]GIJ48810.1 hypothetical protein Val02_56960 [Virgisporangium aliadipatigenens]
MFSTTHGTPIEPCDLDRHFTGLRRIRFRDLRRSCASLRDVQGVTIGHIQDVLGRSFPTTTIGYLFGRALQGSQEGVRAGLIDRP